MYQDIKTEIKKELYKQKPDAHFIGRGNATEAVVRGFQEKINSWDKVDEGEGDYFYEAILNLEYTHKVYFQIPQEEMIDKEGNKILNKKEPAQLLIRWLI